MIEILYIEDDPKFGEIIKDYINLTYDMRCYVTSDINEGFNLIQKHRYDVILIDLVLHGNYFGGIDVIKQYKNYTCAPMIIFTGSMPSPKMLRDIFDAGATEYYDKINFSTICNFITRILNRETTGQILKKEKLTHTDIELISRLENNLDKSNRELSDNLGIAEKTLKKRLERLRKRTGISNIYYIIEKFRIRK